MTQEGRHAEGCGALSAARTSVTQRKKHDDLLFLFHSRSLSTVALPPRATSTPVRFNRVYSKVSLGTLSVVYSPPIFSFIYFFFASLNAQIGTTRLMKQTVQTGVISAFCPLCFPSTLLCWCLRLRCQPVITSLSAVYSRRPPRRHRQDILSGSLSRLGWGGWEAVSLVHV